jgi:hypothetical protein
MLGACPKKPRERWAVSNSATGLPPNGCYRRVSPVPVRPGEGPLTEQTPAVQPCQGNGSSCPTADLRGSANKRAPREETRHSFPCHRLVEVCYYKIDPWPLEKTDWPLRLAYCAIRQAICKIPRPLRARPFSTRCSRLQLAFKLVKEAPVGPIGDDLLRRRLDQADVAHAQCVETDRIFGVVLSPFVTVFTQRLEGIVVA